MAFYGAPIPPVDPNDAKAIRAVSDDHHRQRARGAEDVGIVLGWIATAIRWPFRLILRAIHR
jgi:hypothetical protein